MKKLKMYLFYQAYRGFGEHLIFLFAFFCCISSNKAYKKMNFRIIKNIYLWRGKEAGLPVK